MCNLLGAWGCILQAKLSGEVNKKIRSDCQGRSVPIPERVEHKSLVKLSDLKDPQLLVKSILDESNCFPDSDKVMLGGNFWASSSPASVNFILLQKFRLSDVMLSG